MQIPSNQSILYLYREITKKCSLVEPLAVENLFMLDYNIFLTMSNSSRIMANRTYNETLSIGEPSKYSTNQMVLIATIISSVWIILYKLYFQSVDEIFPKAAIVGELMFNFLCSVVASGIFYYIVVYLEQRRVKKIMYPVLNKHLLTISASSNDILTGIQQAVNGEYSSALPEETIFYAKYKTILLNDPTPIILGQSYNSWREFFHIYINQNKYYIDAMFKYAAYLPPELLIRLDSISNSSFESSLHNTVNYPDSTVGNSANGLWYYIKDLEELLPYSNLLK